MIAFVEKPPTIELHGNHFQLTFNSGGDEISLMLTKKAFYLLKLFCSEADAKWRIADLEAREKVVPFPKPSARKAKRGKA